MTNPFTNGQIIQSDCPAKVYLAENAIRGSAEYVTTRSSLMSFRQCPQRWLRGHAKDDSDSTQFGDMVDALLLRKGEMDTGYAIQPKTYPAPAKHAKVKTGEIQEGHPLPWNANAQICADWISANEGMTIIKADMYDEALAAQRRVMDTDEGSELIKGSKHSVFVVADYQDESTGLTVKVKGLIDMVPVTPRMALANTLADLKTCRDASHRAWQYAVDRFDYDAQGMLYLWLYNAATKENRESFLHLLIENEAPFEVGFRELSVEYLELGGEKILSALRKYCRCLKTGVWPSYDETWTMVEPTTQMMANYYE